MVTRHIFTIIVSKIIYFMFEILGIVYFIWKIGPIAVQKGLEPRRWKWYVVLTFIGSELAGLYLSMALGQKNIFAIGVTCIGFALAGCFTLQDHLLKKDDKKQKKVDINQHVE